MKSTNTPAGMNERNLKVFALPALLLTFAVPVLYALDLARKNRNDGNRMTTATKNHVSTLWMLMGGWNHQYATASTITAITALTMAAFFPMLSNFSFRLLNSAVVSNSTRGAPCEAP